VTLYNYTNQFMKTRKLNFEDFTQNQLPRNQKVNILGGAPTLPPPEIDEDGYIVPPGGTSGNGDGRDPEVKP